MTPDEMRAIMTFLREKVTLNTGATGDVVIFFSSPSHKEMISAGLNAEGVKQILGAAWWDEMVTDILETPGFCEADDAPEQILEYAKDVVSDYLRKRISL